MLILIDIGDRDVRIPDTLSANDFPASDVFPLENAAFQFEECLSVTEGGTMSEFIIIIEALRDIERMEREAREWRELERRYQKTVASLLKGMELEIREKIKRMGEDLKIRVNPRISSIAASSEGVFVSGNSIRVLVRGASNGSFTDDLFDDGFPWHTTGLAMNGFSTEDCLRCPVSYPEKARWEEPIFESCRKGGVYAMTVIKRNGTEVPFDITKITEAVRKANETVDEGSRMTPTQILRIAECVMLKCDKMGRAPSVEEIQDLVERQIMAHGTYEVAKNYVAYRYTCSLARESNIIYEKILSLIECCNEEAKQENSNKNPVVNSTQRDYMAGEVSRDLTEQILPPGVIVKAYREGIIHFHDIDYYAQHMHNCDLVNLEDMLQNGTAITGTLIERPHSFSTAYDILKRTLEQVNSDFLRYSGFSAPVRLLKVCEDVNLLQKFRKETETELIGISANFIGEKTTRFPEFEALLKIKRDAQKIQYRSFPRLPIDERAGDIIVSKQGRKAEYALIVKEPYQDVKIGRDAWATLDFLEFLCALSEKAMLINAPSDMRMSASERWDDGFPWHTTDCAMNALSAGYRFPYPVSYLKRSELTEDWKGISEICTRPLKCDNFKWRDIILVWVFQSETGFEYAPVFRDDESVWPRRTLWDCNSSSISVTVWLPNMIERWKNRDFQESPLTSSPIGASFTGNIAQA